MYLFNAVNISPVEGPQLTYPVYSHCIVGESMNWNHKLDPLLS